MMNCDISIDYNTLYAIGIILTFFVSLFNAINSFKNNRKTLFINVVTSKRVEWINQLRLHISEFVKLVDYFEQKRLLDTDEEIDSYLNEVRKYNTLIKLYLNYKDEDDKIIIEIIDNITEHIFNLYLCYPTIATKFLQEGEESDIKQTVYTEEQIEAEYRKHLISFDRILEQGLINNEEYIILKNELDKSRTIKIKYQTLQHASIAYILIQAKLKEQVQNLTDKVRIYLKKEWDRVKKEAGDM